MKRQVGLLLLGFITACQPKRAERQLPVASAEVGSQLARRWCGSCHLFPEPALLSRRSWEDVLTNMGARLGHPDAAQHPFAALSGPIFTPRTRCCMRPTGRKLCSIIGRMLPKGRFHSPPGLP